MRFIIKHIQNFQFVGNINNQQNIENEPFCSVFILLRRILCTYGRIVLYWEYFG